MGASGPFSQLRGCEKIPQTILASVFWGSEALPEVRSSILVRSEWSYSGERARATAIPVLSRALSSAVCSAARELDAAETGMNMLGGAKAFRTDEPG